MSNQSPKVNDLGNKPSSHKKREKICDAKKDLPPARPFRVLQYRARLAQREDAQQKQHRDYSNSPEAQLAAIARRADTCWRRCRAGLNTNIVVAALTAVMAWTTWGQWQVMEAQTDQLIAQNKTAAEQTNAMVQQNTIANQQLKAMSEQLTDQRTQTGEMVKQSRATEGQLRELQVQNTYQFLQQQFAAIQTGELIESGNIAEENLKEFRRQNNTADLRYSVDRLDRRAILTAGNPVIISPQSGKLEIGQHVRCAVAVTNAGQSTSILEFASVDIVYVDRTKGESVGDGLPKLAVLAKAVNRRTMIPPSRGIDAAAPANPRIITKQDLEAIEFGNLRLYVVVLLRYTDGVGGYEAPAYLFVYDFDTAKFLADSEFGYIDDWRKPGKHRNSE